jgi:PhnB protein
MRICPYVSFNGNCAEAVAFYEKVFNAKAEVMRYKDAPPEEGYQLPEGTENLIMHAQFEIGGGMFMLCDVPPEFPVKIGENITIMVEFEDMGKLHSSFAALEDGGEVSMELAETFWSECFGSLTDKFGVNWNLSLGCP